EKQLLAAWKHERLFQKTQEGARYGPPFVFYEGPPTANGRPGIHHVFARTIKDLVCRYHTMLGQGVTRIAGWTPTASPSRSRSSGCSASRAKSRSKRTASRS